MSGTAEAAVALEFEDFRTFLNAFSANVSQSGMFVESSEPQSPGTEIEFDLRLEGGEALIHGRGEVAWVAGNGDSAASGMGIRFLDLNSESERLITRIVDTRTKAGQKLFDIEREARDGEAAAEVQPAASTRAGADTAEADSLKDRLQKLEQERAEERERLQLELATVGRARDELSERLQEQADDIERWSEQGRHAMVERDKLVAKIKQLQEQSKEQAAEAVRSSEQEEQESVEREQLQEERDLLELRVEEQAAEVTRWSEQGKHAAAERDRLEAEGKALEEQLEAAKSETVRVQTENDGLRDSALDAQAAEEALRGELAEARGVAQRLEDEAGSRESELRAELEKLEKGREELCASLESGQTELDELRRQFEESTDRGRELEIENSSLGEQLVETQERIAASEAAAEAVGQKMEELRRRHDEMASDLAIQKTIAKREKKLSERVRAEHVSLQEDFAEAQATLEELQQLQRQEEFERELAAEDLLASPVLDEDAASDPLAGAARAEGPVEEFPHEGAETDSSSGGSPDDGESQVSVDALESEARDESVDGDSTGDTRAETAMEETAAEEEAPEGSQQSGLWATLVRTLGGTADDGPGSGPMAATGETPEVAADRVES